MRNLNELLKCEIGDYHYLFKDFLFDLKINLMEDELNNDYYYFYFLDDNKNIYRSKLLSFSLTKSNISDILIKLLNYIELTNLGLLEKINDSFYKGDITKNKKIKISFTNEDIENEKMFKKYISSRNLKRILNSKNIDLNKIKEEEKENKLKKINIKKRDVIESLTFILPIKKESIKELLKLNKCLKVILHIN